MRQQNQLLIRALLVAASVLATASPSGLAAPADVHVRVEGVTSTIVDRVVRTDGHDVRASSDSQARHCDGTNHGANATPGPTATAATVDALATIGQTFDGQWSPGFDDYYLRQLGPEREDNDKLWWWGILVNRAFTPVGGCQIRVHGGDEVLWADDAFSNRPFLWLSAPSQGPSPTVLVNTPFTVVVGATNASPTDDDSSTDPYLGAQVGAVTANGQPVPAGVADGGTSAIDGSATITFHQPGWQRVKARGPAGAPGAAPAAIASNSIDVCVEATAGAGCSGAPPSQRPPASGEPGGGLAGPGRSRGTARPAWLRRFAAGTLRDDRARELRWSGPWQRVLSTSAWAGTLSRGTRGATVRLRVGPGRPVFLLRLTGRTARIELRAGGRSTQVALPAALGGGIRIVRGPRLARAGVVRLRVLSGAVRLDGAGRAA
jgi:hypothetical protein